MVSSVVNEGGGGERKIVKGTSRASFIPRFTKIWIKTLEIKNLKSCLFNDFKVKVTNYLVE